MNTEGRAIAWFSCGAASACAAKLASERFKNLRVVYCDTLAEEHFDNIRFLHAVEKWIGLPIELIKSEKYNSIIEVWDKRKYMAGISGAPCTLEMKKIPRHVYQLPNDLHIFGLTADEQKRIDKFEKNNPDLEMEWILRDAGITKEGCYQMLRNTGIALPVMYSMGFKNNNCIGCVKAASAVYWNRVRQFFPEVFAARAEQSRRIGARLVRWKGKRIFLDELPFGDDGEKEKDIECGVICVKEGSNE